VIADKAFCAKENRYTKGSRKDDKMAVKPKTQRAEEQRVRQSGVRKAARQARRPNRDDVARMLLWQMITAIQKKSSDKRAMRDMLDKLRDQIVGGLEVQGFDVRESEDVFDGLARRYANGLFPFRPKRHFEPGSDETE
jgi:hypothetical protein